MLQKMRDNLQGWAAKVVIALIIVTMAMFGFGAFDWFTKADPVVASIGGEDVRQSQLTLEMERQRQRIAAQMGENFDPSIIDADMLRNSVLDGLVNRALLRSAAADMGLAVSESEIDRSIVANTEFQIDGKFDQELYRRLLAGAGHSPASFRREVANSYTLVQLNGGVSDTEFATEAESRTLARLVSQTRDVAFLTIDPASLTDTVAVSDEDIGDYYESHPDEFMTPESVDAAYVELAVDDIARNLDIDLTEDQITARYEADRAAFASNEQRRTAHILLEVGDARDEAAARTELLAVRARIEAGESFEDLAKALSEDAGSKAAGGDLGFVSRDALVPEYAEVAWSLAPGEVSQPVTTPFGVHLIKVLEARSEAYPPLEEKRASIVDSLKRSAAEEIYAGKVRELDELAFESPEGLDTLAGSMGLDVRSSEGVTRQSGLGPFGDAKVREAVFSEDVLEKGFNSRAVDLGDRAVVVRALRHHPAERRNLADVTAEIRIRLVNEAAALAARDRAEAALAGVREGEGSATVAAAAGTEWTVLERARRTAAGIDAAILQAAFGLPRPGPTGRGGATLVDLPGDRIAVVTVSAVYDGDYAALTDSERAQLRQQWLDTVANLEFTALFESIRADTSISRR